MRAHLEREMRQRCTPVGAGGKRVAHQRRGVTGPGPGGFVTPRPAVPLPPQPPLAVQVLHDRHHGGVRQRPVVVESVHHLADQRRAAPLPQPVHDHGFQLTETSHPRSRTWLCQRRVRHYLLSCIEQPYCSGSAAFSAFSGSGNPTRPAGRGSSPSRAWLVLNRISPGGVFHDQEGFTTLVSSKGFAIMWARRRRGAGGTPEYGRITANGTTMLAGRNTQAVRRS